MVTFIYIYGIYICMILYNCIYMTCMEDTCVEMVERMSSPYYLKILCCSVFPMDVSHVVSALASGLVVGWLAKAFDLSKISSESSSQPAALHCHCTCDCPENSKNGLIIFGLAGTLILVLAFSLIWLGVRRIEIPVAVPPSASSSSVFSKGKKGVFGSVGEHIAITS